VLNLDRRQFLKTGLLAPLLPLVPYHPNTDFYWASVREKSHVWTQFVFAFLDGVKVKHAQEAHAIQGWVLCTDLDHPDYLSGFFHKPPKRLLHGQVQILFKSPQAKASYMSLYQHRGMAY
jgi:hypothetical protein